MFSLQIQNEKKSSHLNSNNVLEKNREYILINIYLENIYKFVLGCRCCSELKSKSKSIFVTRKQKRKPIAVDPLFFMIITRNCKQVFFWRINNTFLSEIR